MDSDETLFALTLQLFALSFPLRHGKAPPVVFLLLT
jgi:hypothetical protein